MLKIYYAYSIVKKQITRNYCANSQSMYTSYIQLCLFEAGVCAVCDLQEMWFFYYIYICLKKYLKSKKNENVFSIAKKTDHKELLCKFPKHVYYIYTVLFILLAGVCAVCDLKTTVVFLVYKHNLKYDVVISFFVPFRTICRNILIVFYLYFCSIPKTFLYLYFFLLKLNFDNINNLWKPKK